MILLQFNEKFNNYPRPGTSVSQSTETRRKVIVLHNYIEIIEHENGTCTINDNKMQHTYHPLESYVEILDKLAHVVDIA